MEDNTKDILTNIGESTLKSMFGAVPFAGTALNEAIFDGRNRIKQQRLNHFITVFIEYIKDISEEEINLEYIKSEEFGDIFESILRRVINNGTEDKLNRFKKILAHHILNEVKTDYAETFLDLVSRLNEKQIKILEFHRNVIEGNIDLGEKLPVKGVLDANLEVEISKLRRASNFNVDNGIYQFCLQDLFSKGLLIDNGANRMELDPFELMEITEFGLAFLEFIENNKN